MIEKIVKVPLKEGYKIYVGAGNLSLLGEKLDLAPLEKVVVVSNPRVLSHYGQIVTQSLRSSGWKHHLLEVPEGEKYKSLERASRLYEELITLGVKRQGPLIALGGGVIGDLAGFVAATYMRGLPLIQVPTTLVAQVDSSIGGKVGVNLPRGKNFVGAFYQPKFVLTDVGTLKTLPEKELRAGLAEVIKYAFLEGEDFLSFIESNLDSIRQFDEEVLARLVVRCCKIKAKVVTEDEKDFGRRRILNYGHTVGHALEVLTGYKKYLHGEAIAVGMVCAALISRELGFVADSLVRRHIKIFERVGLPAKLPPLEVEKILDQIEWDKKVQGETRIFVLLRQIGDPIISEVSPGVIRKALVKAARG